MPLAAERRDEPSSSCQVTDRELQLTLRQLKQLKQAKIDTTHDILMMMMGP